MVKTWGKKWLKNFSLALLIGFAVISFWRGIWQLMDLYLFPSNPAVSYIISVLIGLIILVITHKAIAKLM